MRLPRSAVVGASFLLLSALVVAPSTAAAQVKVAWLPRPGNLVQVSAGDATHVWGVTADDSVWRWTGAAWQKMPGQLKQVSAAADGTVWGVDRQDRIYQWTGSGWKPIPGTLIQVSAGSANHVWGVNRSNHVYRWTGAAWQNMGSLSLPSTHVSVGADGAVWGVESYSYLPPGYIPRKPFGGPRPPRTWSSGTYFKSHSGALTQVAAGSWEHVWGLASDGGLHRWTGSSWAYEGRLLKYLSVGADGFLWGIDHAGKLFQRVFADCQELSDKYGILNGLNLVSVPMMAQLLWKQFGCKTRPWWTLPGPVGCLTPASFDGANCYVTEVPSGWKPFVYGNSFYVRPKPGCPAGASFDGANCVVAGAPPGAKKFIWGAGATRAFYYRPLPQPLVRCVAPASFDGANCYVAKIPGGWRPFIHGNAFYVSARNRRCPAGASFDGANCVIAGAPPGAKKFIWGKGAARGFYYAQLYPPVNCQALTDRYGILAVVSTGRLLTPGVAPGPALKDFKAAGCRTSIDCGAAFRKHGRLLEKTCDEGCRYLSLRHHPPVPPVTQASYDAACAHLRK